MARREADVSKITPGGGGRSSRRNRDDEDELFSQLTVDKIGEEKDGVHEVEITVRVTSDKKPVNNERVTLYGGEKATDNLGSEVTVGTGVAEFTVKVPPGKHKFQAELVDGSRSNAVKKTVGEGDSGGKKTADKTGVDVRKVKTFGGKVHYNLIVYPTSKLKWIKGDIHAIPDDDKCTIIGDNPFVADGKKLVVIPVTASANTGLTLHVSGAEPRNVLLDGPTQFEGKRWALASGIGLLLTIVFFAVAVGATFFHSLPTPPANEADTWWSATETAPAKASAKWLWWWLIDVLLLSATIIFAGITAKKNAKVLVWKAKKFNAERKYETKEGKADGGDKKPTAEAVKQGSNRILDWLNIALNSFDLFHEKVRR